MKGVDLYRGRGGRGGRARLMVPWRAVGLGAVGLLLASAVWWAASFRTDLESNTQPRAEEMAGQVLPGDVYGQSFVAPYEGLYSVGVRFATFGRQNDCRLTFRLYDMQAAFELARSDIACGELHDNDYYNFAFPAVENSAGKTFLFSVESTDATAEQSVAVWATPSPDFSEGALHLNFQQRNGDLTFKSACRISLPTALSIYFDPLTRQKPGVFGDKWFYALLLAAYLVVAVAFIRLAARMRF